MNISTGNITVDALAGCDIKGNIIPPEWSKIIKKPNGKTDFLAQLILGDILYWYRPKVTYDESGNIICIQKKFKGDMLQDNYDYFAEKFDCSKDQVRAAFDTLENLGIIQRDFRTVKLSSGVRLSNVLFIDLEKESLDMLIPDIDNTSDEKEEGVSEKIGTATEFFVTQSTKNNPKINKDNSKITPFIPVEEKERENDDEAIYREILMENTEVDALIVEQPSSASNYREYLEIMVDYVCYNKSPLRVKGNLYPSEVVKKRMLELKREHLEYVCSQYDAYVGEITDFKKHCAATLFNSYYEVNNQVSNLMHRNMVKLCAI